jgi:hypothetical protein
MKDKQSPKHYKPAQLREFIQKYRINQPMLCQAIGMNESIFKNKLYQSHPTYFFSDEEYIAILEALSAMANDIQRMIKRAAPGGTMKIKSENIAKKSQNFRGPLF